MRSVHGMDEFASLLRALMAERGLGVRALARRVPCDPGLVSRLRSGQDRPSPRIARCLDDMLGACGDLAALAARQPATRPRMPGLPPAALVSGRSLAGPSGRFTGPVAPELADYFASQLAGHYSADRFLGPTQLIPVAASQYELLCNLANAATGSLRSDLWSVAAGYAGFLGWLYQDAGDLGTSSHWLNEMLERAHRSQDIQLICFTLHNKAMLQADTKDGGGVLDLTGAALRQRAHLCPKVRVLLLQQAAHGTSLIASDDAGDSCDRLLDEAAALVDTVDDGYPWGGSCQTPRYLDVQRATIYTRLGRTRSALDLWEQIIPSMPRSSRRDVGVFRARQAQALADSGEPEQAVKAAAEIAPLVRETGSARMSAELFALRQHMNPWRDEPPGHALAEVLAGISRRSPTGDGTWRLETR